MKQLLKVLAFVLLCQTVAAQTAGTIDLTFSSNGIAFYQNGQFTDTEAGYVTELEDGKLMVFGTWSDTWDGTLMMMRVNPDSTLDATYAGDGIAEFTFDPYEVVDQMMVEPDGKVILALRGPSNVVAYGRLDANGVVDSTFGVNGLVGTPSGAQKNAPFIFRLSNGDYIYGYTMNYIAGTHETKIHKAFSDGSPDLSFGGTGVISLPYFEMADYHPAVLQAGDKLLIAGLDSTNNIVFKRFNDDGTPDAAFGSGGSAVHPFVDSLFIRGVFEGFDGNIYTITLAHGNVNRVSKYDGYGNAVSSFGVSGSYLDNSQLHRFFTLTALANGKVLLTGEKVYSLMSFGSRAMLFALKANGTPDSTFGTPPMSGYNYIIPVSGGAAQIWNHTISSTGKVWAVGRLSTGFGGGIAFIARYHYTTPLSIDDLPISVNDYHVYPNPVDQKLSIVSTSSSTEPFDVYITDPLGRMVSQIPYTTSNSGIARLDMSNLSSGLYFICIHSNNGKAVAKVLVE